jgi:hypothetical protein
LEAIGPPGEGAKREHNKFYSARFGAQLPSRRDSAESLSQVLERLDERDGERVNTVSSASAMGGVPPFFIVPLMPSLYMNVSIENMEEKWSKSKHIKSKSEKIKT